MGTAGEHRKLRHLPKNWNGLEFPCSSPFKLISCLNLVNGRFYRRMLKRQSIFSNRKDKGYCTDDQNVVADDPGRTEILGNVHMTYENQHVDCRNYPWFARTFNKPHHEVENDARVWKQIASIIDSRLSSLGSPRDQVAMH